MQQHSFGTELLVMQSMRKPKRLTIHGNDERDHHVLVKGGEDLRLDERVEQVFEIMSEVYSADAACAKAKLAIRTFKVSSSVASSETHAVAAVLHHCAITAEQRWFVRRVSDLVHLHALLTLLRCIMMHMLL
jgi:Phosphatidylinositol 3- and 4-kinase